MRLACPAASRRGGVDWGGLGWGGGKPLARVALLCCALAIAIAIAIAHRLGAPNPAPLKTHPPPPTPSGVALQYGMIEAISHLIHRDYEAIVEE